MAFWTGLLLGAFIGANLGFLTFAILTVGKTP